MAKPSPMRQLYVARVEGLRRERARAAAQLGLPTPAEGDLEQEIAELADRTGVKRSWVAPPRSRPERSRTSYLVAAIIGVGIAGAVSIGVARRR